MTKIQREQTMTANHRTSKPIHKEPGKQVEKTAGEPENRSTEASKIKEDDEADHKQENTAEETAPQGPAKSEDDEADYNQHRDDQTSRRTPQTKKKFPNQVKTPTQNQKQQEELKNSLKPLQDTHQKIAELKEKYRGNLNNIHDQAHRTEKQIKEDFVKLHQFLHKEEKNLLADLKKEEEEKEQKMRAMEESIVQDLMSVSKIIKDIQQKVDEEDQIFLMTLRDMRERIKEYTDYKPREPEAVSAADIDGYKYTDCLQYRVGKKMLKFRNPVTVTLDPNTAHPNLTVSEDLTAVTLGSTRREDLPDNPERFDRCSCVLGSEGFTSGRHSWVVDVEKQTLCYLGVTAESANRKGIIDLRPECRYWTVRLCEGVYSAITDEGRTRLKVLKTPKKVLVFLDYKAGKVSFSNADDRSHIYTFTHEFKHKVFPFFGPWTVGAPLRICNL
ncbi:E3 ubiquitin-protein ligase TRIM39-like [Latimeria chalumnae]|uniref:E3 ubiquitin-protein ligase TRIM39-like n=1 Tax=Latimeria chalumnae TaxID=7897 RepID=UPI00313C4F61